MEKLGPLLSGIGAVLTGIAAILAVCFAREPVREYVAYLKQSQSQSQTQTVVINLNKAEKEAKELIANSNSEVKLNKSLEKIPFAPPTGSKKAVGLFISSEFRDDVRMKLLKAETEDSKKKIIEEYWRKSLGKDIDKETDLILDNL